MRTIFYLSSIFLVMLIFFISSYWTAILYFLILFIPLIITGVYDINQKESNILRNYPILGHIRYFSLKIAPELHQYFVENNTDGMPFNRNERSFIYARSNKMAGTHPFGTEKDVNQEGYEWIEHSIFPELVPKTFPRIDIGNKDCKQIYSASILNISAMSYGALSKHAILALNLGAKQGNFYHNTGEGSITPHHEKNQGDLVWQIGTGYFGCRDEKGGFSEELFQKKAASDQVKMIEIKLSQGAKPGHGGILPSQKNTEEIAEIRKVTPYTTVFSPPFHQAFDSPKGLVKFIQKLRDLSNGKPVGFKLCIGKEKDFSEVCNAMIEADIYPDFITVDGAEGGTGAAPLEFSDHVGMPLERALVFVSNTLDQLGIKKHIKIIASGKVITGFRLVRNLALGADLCNSARGMMMALGCIQALKCDKNICPTGVTTQNPALYKGLHIQDKSIRVANFQYETILSALEITAAVGLDSIEKLRRRHIHKQKASGNISHLEEIFPYSKQE